MQQEARDADVVDGMLMFLEELRARSAAAAAASASGPGCQPSLVAGAVPAAAVASGGAGAEPTTRIWEEKEEEEDSSREMPKGVGGSLVGTTGAVGAAPAPPLQPRVTPGVLTYSNGDTYKGDILGGRLRHGIGTHSCSDGSRYEGGWRLDQRHGRGTFAAPDGRRYEGEWRHDKAHGSGACTYPDGSQYEGDWEADVRSGWGRLEAVDGQCYEGEWLMDQPHGDGKWWLAGGEGHFVGTFDRGQRVQGRLVLGPKEEYEYVGEFKDGLRHGSGTAVATGLYMYKGPFENDKRHGATGECRYADGGRYVGEWRADKRHGRGTMRGADGTVYDGEWADDVREGQGSCRYASGDRYAGSWRAGVREGQGRCAFANGDRYAGAWVADKMQGVGTMAYANGDRYHGEWREGLRDGVGLMVFADGTSFKGRWERGAWVQTAADPQRCRLRGGGLARAVAGSEGTFVIQARDQDDNPRLSGGDAFIVKLLRPAAGPSLQSPEDSMTTLIPMQPPALTTRKVVAIGGDDSSSSSEGPQDLLEVAAEGRVADGGDGTYTASYRLVTAGRYYISVTADDGSHMADSPYPLHVLPGPVSPAHTTVTGAGRNTAKESARAVFCVQARDVFGNMCDTLTAAEVAAALPLRAALLLGSAAGSSSGVVPVECVPCSGGRWECSYTPPAPGLYVLEVLAPQADPAAGSDCAAVRNTGIAGSSDSEGNTAATQLGGWRHIRGGPFGVRVAEAAPSETAGDVCRQSSLGVVDKVSWWRRVAQREYEALDGCLDGFDEGLGAAGGRGQGSDATAGPDESAFVAANPSVAVVERLEDLWLLSKLQRERRAAEEAARIATPRKPAAVVPAPRAAAEAQARPARSEVPSVANCITDPVSETCLAPNWLLSLD